MSFRTFMIVRGNDEVINCRSFYHGFNQWTVTEVLSKIVIVSEKNYIDRQRGRFTFW